MKKRIALSFLIAFVALTAGYAQAPQGAATSQSVVPQPPQMTVDQLFNLQGKCSADREIQSQYISQLQQKILALNTELEDLKKTTAKPVEAKKGQ